jgi:hypothetical protein
MSEHAMRIVISARSPRRELADFAIAVSTATYQQAIDLEPPAMTTHLIDPIASWSFSMGDADARSWHFC